MKRILGGIRRADQDFHMIEPGDSVAAGVSGGKDSLVMLYALARYRQFSPNPFQLTAVTLAMDDGGARWDPVRRLCDALDVPCVVQPSDIRRIVFEERREKNPCALCARMRRGALVELCGRLGANKLALGHHRDDALETFLLSLLYEGRIHTFHPATRLEGSGVTQIRPMVYLAEKQIIRAAKALELPVMPSGCPVDRRTRREDMAELLRQITRMYPRARETMLSALQNDAQYSLWEKDRGPEKNFTEPLDRRP